MKAGTRFFWMAEIFAQNLHGLEFDVFVWKMPESEESIKIFFEVWEVKIHRLIIPLDRYKMV